MAAEQFFPDLCPRRFKLYTASLKAISLFRPLMRTQSLIIICICLFASANAFAGGPNYQVFPQLKTLAVSYHVETNKRKTVIYATNHEKFAIICDAEMTTNKQEKSKGQEKLMGPEKTVIFSFSHGYSITDVRLYLMCEASNSSASDTSAKSVSASDIEKSTINEKTVLTEKSEAPEKQIIIIEEDLGKMSH